MQSPQPGPPAADLAPAEPKLTAYDRKHAVTYVRLLDAAKEGADWREVSRIVLRIRPDQNADRARRAFDPQSCPGQMVGPRGVSSATPRRLAISLADAGLRSRLS